MPLASYIIFMVLLLGMGSVFLTGRGAMFIAGYNTMSKEEQDKIDEGRLTKGMGKLLFGLAGLLTLYFVLMKQGYDFWGNVVLGLFILSAFGFTLFSGKYYKNH